MTTFTVLIGYKANSNMGLDSTFAYNHLVLI